VEQRHGPAGHDQIDRHAIGNRHGQEDPGRGGDPAIDPLDLEPPAAGIYAHHLNAVHLVAQSNRREFRQLAAEPAPAAHHLPDRCVAPEAEVEPATRL